MIMIKDGIKPDLIFFYSLNIPSSIINSFEQGNDIYQTVNGTLFADKEETIPIGRFAFNIIVFDGLIDFPDGKLYESSGSNVYYLPEGTITHNINGVFEKTNSDKFIVPSDTTKPTTEPPETVAFQANVDVPTGTLYAADEPLNPVVPTGATTAATRFAVL